MLIGRKREQQQLLRTKEEEEAMFVAVYGRRRVGKTFLVRETFNNDFTFYHTGLAKSPLRKQLAAWQLSLREYGLNKATLPRTWLDAFQMLKEVIRQSTKKKKIIFIDELPWMDTLRSGFVNALEFFWNGWASARKDVVLIVCGSATSWIINKIIRNHGGLHNRVNTRIHLQPFTLHECEQYARQRKLGMNRQQLMECYMVLGGVPFYWSKLQRDFSLSQNIDNLFFAQNGELRNEFHELYASLFRNPDAYIAVVNTLGTKRAGMTREKIISEGKISDNGKLSEVLKDLEACGFIRKYKAIGQKCKDAVFQLIDSYTLFYYKFILNNIHDDQGFWSKQISAPVYYNWCGLAFERVCLMHIAQIKKALGISGIISSEYAWHSKITRNEGRGAQIDLIIDREDNVIDLCEIKYTKERYEASSEENDIIQNRRTRFVDETKTAKAVHLILISANGIKRNTYSGEFQNILTSECLFEE